MKLLLCSLLLALHTFWLLDPQQGGIRGSFLQSPYLVLQSQKKVANRQRMMARKSFLLYSHALQGVEVAFMGQIRNHPKQYRKSSYFNIFPILGKLPPPTPRKDNTFRFCIPPSHIVFISFSPTLVWTANHNALNKEQFFNSSRVLLKTLEKCANKIEQLLKGMEKHKINKLLPPQLERQQKMSHFYTKLILTHSKDKYGALISVIVGHIQSVWLTMFLIRIDALLYTNHQLQCYIQGHVHKSFIHPLHHSFFISRDYLFSADITLILLLRRYGRLATEQSLLALPSRVIIPSLRF